VESTGNRWVQNNEEIDMLNRVVFAPDGMSTVLESQEQPTVRKSCYCLLIWAEDIVGDEGDEELGATSHLGCGRVKSFIKT
jgi:hypothetical protein